MLDVAAALPCVGRRPTCWTVAWPGLAGVARPDTVRGSISGAQGIATALRRADGKHTAQRYRRRRYARLSAAGDLLQTQCFKLRQGRGPAAPWRRALYVPPTI